LDGKSKLEAVAGVVLIFLGILFVIGFGLDLQDLITDAIFIAFGALLIRNAYNKRGKHFTQNS
jgi:drug/metabolite transporter (DMT)-like permease